MLVEYFNADRTPIVPFFQNRQLLEEAPRRRSARRYRGEGISLRADLPPRAATAGPGGPGLSQDDISIDQEGTKTDDELSSGDNERY